MVDFLVASRSGLTYPGTISSNSVDSKSHCQVMIKMFRNWLRQHQRARWIKSPDGEKHPVQNSASLKKDCKDEKHAKGISSNQSLPNALLLKTFDFVDSSIPQLPTELLEKIFDCADWNTLTACSLTSERFYDIICKRFICDDERYIYRPSHRCGEELTFYTIVMRLREEGLSEALSFHKALEEADRESLRRLEGCWYLEKCGDYRD